MIEVHYDKKKRARFAQTYLLSEINLQLTLQGIFRGCNIKNLKSVLDVGCGRARELLRCQGSTELLVGVDIVYYKEWKSFDTANFVIADSHFLPFKQNTFDFVFLKDLLHHILKSKSSVIDEAFEACKDKGLLRIIEANRYHINPILVYKMDKSHEHFTKRELQKIAQLHLFDELYSYELLPYFSPRKRDLLWNFFACIIFVLTTWRVTRKVLFLYTCLKERFLRNFLTYHVISKSKTSKRNLDPS